MRRLFAVIILLTLTLSGVAPTAAQLDGQASCAVWEDGVWSQPTWVTFEQCVTQTAAQMQTSSMGQGLAVWGTYRLNVRANGEVYYGLSNRGQVSEWLLWGSVSSGAQSDDSEQTATEGLIGLLNDAERDIGAFWAGVFRSRGLLYEAPDAINIYYGEESTPCGLTIPDNAFYCPRDHSIYLDWGLMNSELQAFGEFGPVVVLAHEWGHAVQGYMGRLTPGRNWGITIELQADCFAGAYARYAVNDSSTMTADQVEDGAISLYNKGDNIPWMNYRAHGTPEQRLDAFNRGYEGGANACWSLTD